MKRFSIIKIYIEVALLSMFANDLPCELNVLGHDCDPLGVDGAQVGVLKQTHQIRLCCLLKRKHSVALEPQVHLLKIKTRSLSPFGVKVGAKIAIFFKLIIIIFLS